MDHVTETVVLVGIGRSSDVVEMYMELRYGECLSLYPSTKDNAYTRKPFGVF